MGPPHVSPIALAVYRKQFRAAQLLIKSGSDPTVSEEFGESAYGLSLLQVGQARGARGARGGASLCTQR